MRVLALSGGGFRGAFQVPVIEYLLNLYQYDLILGVSVGSINGALAAQGDLDIMHKFWESIDCKNPIFGVPGFLSFAAHRGKGLFSLKPVRDKLEQYVSLDKIKIPFGAGVVARETGHYYTLLANKMKTNKELHDAIIGSSAIAGLMEPVIMDLEDTNRPMIISDGGHRNVLPEYPPETTHIDAIFCNPLTPDRRKRAQVDRIIEAAAWAFDIQMDSYTFADFEKLQLLCSAGNMTANVYAPNVSIGSLLTSDADTLKQRMYQGICAINRPIQLGL